MRTLRIVLITLVTALTCLAAPFVLFFACQSLGTNYRTVSRGYELWNPEGDVVLIQVRSPSSGMAVPPSLETGVLERVGFGDDFIVIKQVGDWWTLDLTLEKFRGPFDEVPGFVGEIKMLEAIEAFRRLDPTE